MIKREEGRAIAEEHKRHSQPPAHVMTTNHLKKMYDRISGLAKIGVWEFDLVTEKMTWTDIVYDLFEIPRGTELERSDALKFYDERSLREMEQLRSEAIRSGSGFAMDILIRTAKGNERYIRLTADIEQENGKSIRIFGTKQDVTAERAAQQKVQSLQNKVGYLARSSAMEVMASTLAHKVNQPLAAAANFLSAGLMIARRETVTLQITHCLEEALQSTLQAGEIIRQMRSMTRVGTTSRETFPLEEVVQQALSIVSAKYNGLIINFDLGPTTILYGDFFHIQQVFINLFFNACEAAADEECQMDIQCSKGETHLEIRVSDNGPGIASNIFPNVFEAFVTDKAEGLGIGLSVAQTIIEAHGGHIRAENRPDGGGASFYFSLPYLVSGTKAKENK